MVKRFLRVAMGAMMLGAFASRPAIAEPPLEVRISDRGALRDLARDMLELALSKSSRGYEITIVHTDATLPRLMRLLESGPDSLVTVHWAATRADWEESLAPIRIPIDRGLVGFRVLLIRSDFQIRFDGVNDLAGLKPFTFGQGDGWRSVAVMRAAGLTVVEFPEFDGLFRMAATGRFDALPRSVIDARREVTERASELPELAIERGLVLVDHSAAVYFFVNKQNEALRDAITAGLLTAYDDGSFMRLFSRHPDVAAGLRLVKAGGRRAIDLDQPVNDPARARFYELN